MCTFGRDAEHSAGQHIRGSMEAADIGRTCTPYRRIRLLGSAGSEFQQDIAGSHLLDP
ncbi:hypothetical protein D3C75_1156390 [compost metagenome]